MSNIFMDVVLVVWKGGKVKVKDDLGFSLGAGERFVEALWHVLHDCHVCKVFIIDGWGDMFMLLGKVKDLVDFYLIFEEVKQFILVNVQKIKVFLRLSRILEFWPVKN